MSSSTVRLSRTLARGCKIVLRIADMSMMPTQLLVQVPQDRESERATEPHRETETERHTHTHIEKRYDECKPTPLKHAHTQEQTRKRMHTCKLFSLPLHANLVCTHTHTHCTDLPSSESTGAQRMSFAERVLSAEAIVSLSCTVIICSGVGKLESE